MALAEQTRRPLPSEDRAAIWITPELKRQIRLIAADQGRTQNEVTDEIIAAGLAVVLKGSDFAIPPRADSATP